MAENIAEIGIAAGKIWSVLSKDEKGLPVAQIVKKAKISSADANLSLGWLAREGKVEFQKDGRTTRIRLAQHELKGDAE